MTHFQLIKSGDKFWIVPHAGTLLHRKYVDRGRYKKNHIAKKPLPLFIMTQWQILLIHNIYSSISPLPINKIYPCKGTENIAPCDHQRKSYPYNAPFPNRGFSRTRSDKKGGPYPPFCRTLSNTLAWIPSDKKLGPTPSFYSDPLQATPLPLSPKKVEVREIEVVLSPPPHFYLYSVILYNLVNFADKYNYIYN